MVLDEERRELQAPIRRAEVVSPFSTLQTRQLGTLTREVASDLGARAGMSARQTVQLGILVHYMTLYRSHLVCVSFREGVPETPQSLDRMWLLLQVSTSFLCPAVQRVRCRSCFALGLMTPPAYHPAGRLQVLAHESLSGPLLGFAAGPSSEGNGLRGRRAPSPPARTKQLDGKSTCPALERIDRIRGMDQ